MTTWAVASSTRRPEATGAAEDTITEATAAIERLIKS